MKRQGANSQTKKITTTKVPVKQICGDYIHAQANGYEGYYGCLKNESEGKICDPCLAHRPLCKGTEGKDCTMKVRQHHVFKRCRNCACQDVSKCPLPRIAGSKLCKAHDESMKGTLCSKCHKNPTVNADGMLCKQCSAKIPFCKVVKNGKQCELHAICKEAQEEGSKKPEVYLEYCQQHKCFNKNCRKLQSPVSAYHMCVECDEKRKKNLCITCKVNQIDTADLGESYECRKCMSIGCPRSGEKKTKPSLQEVRDNRPWGERDDDDEGKSSELCEKCLSYPCKSDEIRLCKYCCCRNSRGDGCPNPNRKEKGKDFKTEEFKQKPTESREDFIDRVSQEFFANIVFSFCKSCKPCCAPGCGFAVSENAPRDETFCSRCNNFYHKNNKGMLKCKGIQVVGVDGFVKFKPCVNSTYVKNTLNPKCPRCTTEQEQEQNFTDRERKLRAKKEISKSTIDISGVAADGAAATNPTIIAASGATAANPTIAASGAAAAATTTAIASITDATATIAAVACDAVDCGFVAASPVLADTQDANGTTSFLHAFTKPAKTEKRPELNVIQPPPPPAALVREILQPPVPQLQNRSCIAASLGFSYPASLSISDGMGKDLYPFSQTTTSTETLTTTNVAGGELSSAVEVPQPNAHAHDALKTQMQNLFVSFDHPTSAPFTAPSTTFSRAGLAQTSTTQAAAATSVSAMETPTSVVPNPPCVNLVPLSRTSAETQSITLVPGETSFECCRKNLFTPTLNRIYKLIRCAGCGKSQQECGGISESCKCPMFYIEYQDFQHEVFAERSHATNSVAGSNLAANPTSTEPQSTESKHTSSHMSDKLQEESKLRKKPHDIRIKVDTAATTASKVNNKKTTTMDPAHYRPMAMASAPAREEMDKYFYGSHHQPQFYGNPYMHLPPASGYYSPHVPQQQQPQPGTVVPPLGYILPGSTTAHFFPQPQTQTQAQELYHGNEFYPGDYAASLLEHMSTLEHLTFLAKADKRKNKHSSD